MVEVLHNVGKRTSSLHVAACSFYAWSLGESQKVLGSAFEKVAQVADAYR